MTQADLEPNVSDMSTDFEVERRAAFIQALRDCADFLVSHPRVQCPRYGVLNVFLNTREEMAHQAKAATWEKVYSGEWFYLRRSFGGDLALDITTPRSTVCRRVVTGTRAVEARPAGEEQIIEWVCDDASLLSAPEAP